MSQPFLTGIIEGFYGRPWPHEVRLAYVDILHAAGFNTCIYAPKSDAVLRREWGARWNNEQEGQLRELASEHRAKGLLWGVGLSPMELYKSYGRSEKETLRSKIEYLLGLGVSVLGILFDDMPGDVPDLAERQGEIMADVRVWAPGIRLLMCPTYYSHDRVLQKYFGDMPEGYWPDLGRALPGDVDIFWTGNRVVSRQVSAADVDQINTAFGRKVCLWDNYPVNDGPKRADYLYLEPLGDRDPALRDRLTGHLCNPMNQGYLSLPALAGLAQLYGTGSLKDGDLARWLGESTLAQLRRDSLLFSEEGLVGLGQERRSALVEVYALLPGPAGAEVVAWLQGDYAFDPACLTD